MPHRRRPRIAPSVAALGLVLAAGATALLAACNGTTTIEDAPPITGVRVDSAALFGASGCGTDDARIAKFAATLSSRPYQADRAPLTPIYVRGSVFDCIGDGTFLGVRLTAHYQIRVFGYSQAAFAANPNVTNAASGIQVDTTDAGSVTRTLSDEERETALRQGASLVATCDADQYEDIVSTATCVVELDTRPKPAPADAGSDAGDASADASADADANDASDDASTDASDTDASDTDASSDAGD